VFPIISSCVFALMCVVCIMSTVLVVLRRSQVPDPILRGMTCALLMIACLSNSVIGFLETRGQTVVLVQFMARAALSLTGSIWNGTILFSSAARHKWWRLCGIVFMFLSMLLVAVLFLVIIFTSSVNAMGGVSIASDCMTLASSLCTLHATPRLDDPVIARLVKRNVTDFIAVCVIHAHY
jgi:hypothetical protein